MSPGRSPAASMTPRRPVELAAALGVDVSNPAIWEQALVHRSWAFENGGVPHNERLEFLGDAVLGLVVTDALYTREPDMPEGDLARIRSAAVREETLADVARSIVLGEWIKLGVGETATGGADKDSILGDTLEAVIGAVYVDCGLDVVTDVIRRLLGGRLEQLRDPSPGILEPKTALQELASARFGTVPVYEVTGTGPDHEPTYRAVVFVHGEQVGTGSGTSKKRAERAAARMAWEALTGAPTSADDAHWAPGDPSTTL